MKNRIFAFNDAATFEKELAQFSNWCKENGSPTVCFQIHSEELDPGKLRPVWETLERVFPKVPWFGNSTSGNIEVSLGGIRQLEINATSGSIRAALPENPGFTARVSTTSGDVTCAIPASKEGDRYVCGDGSAKVEITATSGDVRIEPVQTGNTEK